MQRAVHARTGWANDERDLMWSEVRRASEEGGTLKRAFDMVSEKTGRKPNSIRNYYYQSLKENNAPEELCSMRARPFVPFHSDEIRELLRTVLTERARGVSVRACVSRMSGGDRKLALRYQNKYRSILAGRPELVDETIRELREKGIECPSPYISSRVRKVDGEANGTLDNPGEVIAALRQMLDGDGAQREMRHREEIDRMTVRCDLLRLELARREELLLESRRAFEEVRGGAMELMESCRELLSVKEIKRAMSSGMLEKKIEHMADILGAEEN